VCRVVGLIRRRRVPRDRAPAGQGRPSCRRSQTARRGARRIAWLYLAAVLLWVMTKTPIPLLYDLLVFDTETGQLFWRERGPQHFVGGSWTADEQARRFNTRYANKEAFTAVDARGYRIGSINNVLHSAHRVCWAMASGEWPSLQVDHINGIRHDNRIANLQLVTNRQNSLNSAMKSSNTVGLAGVSKHRGKYRAHIKIHGKQKFLGYFDNPADAHAAYCLAKTAAGFSARHGTAT
jgi:HNH endonuclease